MIDLLFALISDWLIKKKSNCSLSVSLSLLAKTVEEPIYSLPPDSYPSPNPGWVIYIYMDNNM